MNNERRRLMVRLNRAKKLIETLSKSHKLFESHAMVPILCSVVLTTIKTGQIELPRFSAYVRHRHKRSFGELSPCRISTNEK